MAPDTSPDQHAEYVRVEHGKQIDCEAQGCDPPHSDNGTVSTWPERHFGPPPLDKPAVLNNHACQWVTRTITYSPWRQIDGEPDGS